MNEEHINPETGNSYSYDTYISLKALHDSGQEIFLAAWTGPDTPMELMPAFGK